MPEIIRLKVPPVAEARGASCAPKGSRFLNRAGIEVGVADVGVDFTDADSTVIGAEVTAGADSVGVVGTGVVAWKTISNSRAPLAVGTFNVHAVLLSSSTSASIFICGTSNDGVPTPGIFGALNSIPSVSVENTHTAPI